MAENKPGILRSFIGGLILTLVLVIAVPVIISWLIEPIVIDMIGDTEIAGLSSGAVGGVIMFVVMIAFMLLLGGGAILRKYGVIGIIGLVAAYYLMGNIYGAVVPIAVVVLLGIISYLMERRRSKK